MKKPILFVFIFTLLFPFHLYSQDCGSLSNRAALCIEQANKLKGEGNFKKSLEVLTEFKNKFPDEIHHYVEYLLAELYIESGEPKKGIKAFEDSVRLCETFAPGWHGLGKTAYESGDYERAGLAFEKACLHAEKKDKSILFASAVSFLKCDNREKGFELLTILVKDWNQDENHVNTFAAAGIQLKKQGLVLETLDALIERNPDKLFLLKLAANTALSQDNPKKALSYLTVYSFLHDTDFKTDKLAADLARSVNSPKRAVGFYEAALKKKQDLGVYQGLVSALMELSDFDRAGLKVSEGLDKYPDCPKLLKFKNYIFQRKAGVSTPGQGKS
jgi:tetratricopeptide (TPR) repeat protein